MECTLETEKKKVQERPRTDFKATAVAPFQAALVVVKRQDYAWSSPPYGDGTLWSKSSGVGRRCRAENLGAKADGPGLRGEKAEGRFPRTFPSTTGTPGAGSIAQRNGRVGLMVGPPAWTETAQRA